ncbi:MAG: YebC/PmpR family DNA-binding transcriptional regulator [Candidatus Peregrinibacteria bacterium]|nr:YebC/PmpR family DNA-binding transcriptional regulator [Candidatus Peregrinibacteria bacterium]
MSGHSKWHNIQARKSVTDAKKGQSYSKHAKLIEVAARSGGDMVTNSTLRSAVERAKADGVPNANIERSIKKGTGELKDDTVITEGLYEAFGPAGTVLLAEVLTDNKNRSLQSIKLILQKNGGAIGEAGTVAWMFDKVGLIEVERGNGNMLGSARTAEDIELAAIDAGASDVSVEDGYVEVRTDPSDLHAVKKGLEAAGCTIKKSEITYLPKNTLQVADVEKAKQVLKLIDLLEEDDDVTNVFSNFEVDDAIADLV